MLFKHVSRNTWSCCVNGLYMGTDKMKYFTCLTKLLCLIEFIVVKPAVNYSLKHTDCNCFAKGQA